MQKLMSKSETWFLVGFNHGDRESRAVWEYTGWDFPVLMDASASLQCESQQVSLTEPLCHPFSQHLMGYEGITAPSLPCHSWNGAVPLSWCCSLAAISPFCQFPETISSKSHLRLKTKQKRLDVLLFPCQKLYVPCQVVTCNTLNYRHTSLMLTQSRETLTALSHIISGLMHQGKASALWWGLKPPVGVFPLKF